MCIETFMFQFQKYYIQIVTLSSQTLILLKQEYIQNMQNPIPAQKFYFQVMTQPHMDACVEGLAKTFSTIQFMTALKISYEGIQLLSREICILGIKRGLSIVARDKQTGEIAGCFANFDIADQKQFAIAKFDPQMFDPFFDILTVVGHDFLQERHAFEAQGIWVHIWLAGVFQGFKGQKLTRKMLDYSLKLFKQKGYKYSAVELVSKYTQQTFLNSSKYFESMNEIKFSEYEFKGKKPMPDAKQDVKFGFCDLQKLDL